MARGVNKAIILGYVGNDPETRYTQGGMAITNISVATTSVRKDRDGNQIEDTQWHKVVFFGKLGEIAGEYLRKGSQVYVEGSIRYEKFEGNDGNEVHITKIIADEMQMLGGRNDGERSGGSGGQRQQPQRQGGQGRVSPQRQAYSGGQRQQYTGRPQNRQEGQSAQQPPLDDFADDDIPF